MGRNDLDEFFGLGGGSTATRPSTRTATRVVAPAQRRARTADVPRSRKAPRGLPPSRGSRPVAGHVLRPSSQPVPQPRRRPAPIDGSGTDARRRTQRRLLVFVLVIAMLTAAIGAKLADLQLSDRDRWIAYGASQRDGYRVLAAGRGGIFDRDGHALALSAARLDVVADPAVIEDPAAVAGALVPILHVDEATLADQLEADGRYALLAAAVPPAAADKIATLDLAGISFVDRYVRQNPSGDLAASVIGRTVADGGVDESDRQGLSGMELRFDEALTGTPGKLYFERDPRGRTIAGGHERTEVAQPGTDVYLTIDQSLQFEAERALKAQVAETGATSGMVVITRPSTGEILTMASVAVDDEGKVANTPDNRPVTAVFEPGSVNKVITIAGAIEEGVVDPDTVLEVPDHLQLYDKTFTDHDPHPTRPWSVTDILVTSSNIGTIKIARQLGSERVDQYLRKFGFGETTGLGFPSEEDGIMLPLDRWSGTSIGAIPIGQGISVTALQMLAAYNVIANDGMYVSPRLVAATDVGAGRVEAPASKQRRVVSVETAKAMQMMLEKVVSEGTGTKAEVPGYPAAGKTGTARIPQGIDTEDGYLDANGRYHYQSSFVGFVSGADLSVMVTLQDPDGTGYGGDVAAPVFAHLSSFALRRFQIPPPSLLDRTSITVPELSDSAREIDDEDPRNAAGPAAG